MSVLMLINLKGGVAKTTSAVAIAECLASEGHRTLLIDADHQSMSGELLLGESRYLKCDDSRRTLHDLMAAMLKPTFTPDQFEKYIVRKVSNIDGGLPKLSVLPCSVRMDRFSRNMAKARRGHNSNDEFLRSLNARRKQIRRWIDANFDFTIIDGPPSLALQVQFFLSVTDAYIVPTIPDRLSVRGSLHLVDRLDGDGYKVSGMGTLWSMYRPIAAHQKKIAAVGAGGEDSQLLPPPFKTIIPHANRISEATEPGAQPKTFRQKYTLEFARLFESLCAEVVERAESLRQQQQKRPAAEAAGVMLNERPRAAVQPTLC